MKPEESRSRRSPQPLLAGKYTILIVQNEPAQTEVLLAALTKDYSVKVIRDARAALKSAASVNPDLILLDITLPEIAGDEVCSQLRANPATREIPIVFLTAASETAHEVKGLRLGAVDCLAKPLNSALVKARVQTHLALRRTHLEAIRERDQARAAYQELCARERLRDDLVHMIVHDLRSPLAALNCFLDTLALPESTPPGVQENLRVMRHTTKDVCRKVGAILEVSRLESGQMPLHRELVDLRPITQDVVRRLSPLAHGRGVSLQLPDQPVVAYCDPSLTGRVVQNLLENALKFTPEEGSIRLELIAEDQGARFSITDTGGGIPAECHPIIFDKLSQIDVRTRQPRRSMGLGLPFCRLAVDAQGGRIDLQSELGRGTTFHVWLPRSREDAKSGTSC